MTIEQRVAVLEEIFSKLQDYYTSAYSGEEIDARLASAGVPIGITKEYKSVAEMNQDFTGTDVQRGQFVLILPDSTASADYGKVYLKGTANWVYAFTLTTLTSIKGPIGPPGKNGVKGDPGEAGSSFAILGYFDTLDALKAAVPNPKAGDVYGVGTAPPYNIYIWDSVHGKWVANGNLQGPQGKQGIQGPEGKQGPDGKQGPEGPVGGSSNFVRYDAAQSLTAAQKTQARTNIGISLETIQPQITASGMLKGDGAGGVSAAEAGTDFQAPLKRIYLNSGYIKASTSFEYTGTALKVVGAGFFCVSLRLVWYSVQPIEFAITTDKSGGATSFYNTDYYTARSQTLNLIDISTENPTYYYIFSRGSSSNSEGNQIYMRGFASDGVNLEFEEVP